MKMNILRNINKKQEKEKNANKNLSSLKKEENEINSKDYNDNNKLLSNSDFFDSGKIKTLPELNIKKFNQSFRGGANNLLSRNYLSINNPNFDNIKIKSPKKQMTIFHQTFEENNYLEPFKSFRYEHKNDIPDYAMNQEMYNLFKKKLFNKEVKSNIKSGKQISRIDFLNKKKKMFNVIDKSISASNDTTDSIREKFYVKIKKYENPLNIKEKINAEKENACDNLIKEKYVKKKMNPSLSAKQFETINPLDSKRKVLKCNKILRSRNWWQTK